jgi:DNA-binding SARP family transcriptional activator/cytochrome c-type biogenesis protein CcmH/NrfG
MRALNLALLGGFDGTTGDGRPLALRSRSSRALLAYLAVAPGQRHARDKLATLLWGDRTDAQARANLRKALSRLRQGLPGRASECLDLGRSDVALRESAVDVDVIRFDRLAADGTPGRLERAASLHRGPFLEGWGDCGEGFDDWLLAERRRLDETLRQVLRRLLDHYVSTGAIDRAVRTALRQLTLDPLEESAHRTLMRLYLQQDRLGAALDQYDRCREVLARELGVEPSAETEQLRREVCGLLPAAAGAPRRETDELPARGETARATAEAPERRQPDSTGRPSIAVLSFAGVEADAVHQRLGEGMAEDIATELGRFPEIDVIAPASALAYRRIPARPARVGDELGSTYVLEGRLRRDGEQLRITARLVETATGRQLWAERYDGALTQLFDVQDEVVQRIVGTLAGRLESARLERARRSRPEDWEAYDLWLQGWSALKGADLSAIRQARDFFERAARRDPTFGRAYSGLALTLWTEWACFSWNPWVFMQPEAVDLARKAVRLEDHDHRAHCILGVAELYARNYESARRHLLTALRLNPNDADVLAHASFGMALIGEHDLAVDAGRRALRLQPHHPDWYAGMIGIALFSARRHEEAIAAMAPAPEPFCSAPAFVAAAYAHLGQTREGVPYRQTVYRHYRTRLARREFSEETSCIDWLLGIDPFRLSADVDHYADGLRKAGFE